MQPMAPVHVPPTDGNVSKRPLSRRRQITIGGPDRDLETEKECSTQSDARELDQVPAVSDPAVGVSKRSQPSAEAFLTSPPGSTTTTRSARRPYPPTSWKSASAVDFIGLDSDEGTCQRSSTRILPARSDAPPQGCEKSETQELFVDSVIAAVQGTKLEEHSTTEKLVRTGSRRQYTIGSSNPPRHAALPPSKGSSDHSLHATDRVATRRPVLPDPQAAYAHTFYYTTCPHTSPPKPRPLNVQPTLVQYHNNLLAHSPSDLLELQNKSKNDALNIYILEGPCSDCDLSARRSAESATLDTYTHKLEDLTIQLSLLRRDIASEHPQTLTNTDGDAFTTFTLPSTLELTPEATQAIVEIEDQLNELIKKRDHEVKLIWLGYTARWGPGTVQIHRDDNVKIPSRSRSRSTARTASSTTSFGVASADTTPEKSVTASSTISTGANRTLPPSRKSSFAARTHASSTQERYSDGAHDIVVDSSVDGVKGRGRMLVDWIRPARAESKPDGAMTSRGGKAVGKEGSARVDA